MLGNGSLLVGLDYFGQVKDFYFHYAGLENHSGHNLVHKIGIFVDDTFSWLDNGTWNITIESEKDMMASSILFRNDELGLELHFSDCVYNEKNVFIREVTCKNLFARTRKVKLFFNQQFNISGNHTGDTAYYDPIDNVLLHYKGRRVFIVNVRANEFGIDEYSVGLFGIEGKEGTYKDAEDGRLTQNPIEHGQVDSVISISLDIESEGEKTLHYWITAATSIAKAKDLNEEVIIRGAKDMMETTKNYWHAWALLGDFTFSGLDISVSDLFKRSLLVIRTHVNKNGAIIASGDSDILQFGRDYYEYVWPRDASFTAMALGKAGDFNASRRFFEFAKDVITERGYFMHKYRPDKSLGSSWHPWVVNGIPQLPIQEDETAIVLIALWNHFELTHDLEFIESLYNSVIKKAADFMVSYRDEKTGLPKPSYDIWEMQYGISTYTASSVYGALVVASQFARLLGKTSHEKVFTDTAEIMKNAILKYLYNEETGTFYKYIDTSKQQLYQDETYDISSIYGVFKFGVLPHDDKRVKKAFDLYCDRLEMKSMSGGVARFSGDRYNHQGGDYPGNPWIVTTMWVAQYHIACARQEKDLEKVKEYLKWVVDKASISGMLPEQINVYTKEPLSATPLIWSHAEFVSTVIMYMEKVEELGIGKIHN